MRLDAVTVTAGLNAYLVGLLRYRPRAATRIPFTSLQRDDCKHFLLSNTIVTCNRLKHIGECTDQVSGKYRTRDEPVTVALVAPGGHCEHCSRTVARGCDNQYRRRAQLAIGEQSWCSTCGATSTSPETMSRRSPLRSPTWRALRAVPKVQQPPRRHSVVARDRGIPGPLMRLRADARWRAGERRSHRWRGHRKETP